jgi:hypothetical protein
MIIFHHDKQRSVRVLMNSITGLEPGIAGGWFMALCKEKERLAAAPQGEPVFQD